MASSECTDALNSRCRVCLATNLKMNWIKNTLLDVFEKLSNTKLNPEDRRPHTICYICYSQLQRCCRFSDMCHKSEQFQKEHLLRGAEFQTEGVVPPTAITHNLAVTVLPFMSVIEYSNQGNTEVKVKKELLIKEEPIVIEDSTVEYVTVDDNTISLEGTLVEVNTETNNVCALLFSCDVCNKTFNDCSTLVKHKKTHTGEKPYACNMCNKSFTDCSALIKHKRTHTGKKPYACNMCNKSFTQGGALLIHKRIHTGEKPYTCTICNKSFSVRCSLTAHKIIHTGEKPYTCNTCNKSFTECRALTKHKRTHTGEKPYACNMCNKSFTDCSALIKHKRTHTGEKPYICNMCNKSFTHNGALLIHRRIHTGEKPHTCTMQ